MSHVKVLFCLRGVGKAGKPRLSEKEFLIGSCLQAEAQFYRVNMDLISPDYAPKLEALGMKIGGLIRGACELSCRLVPDRKRTNL
jgi:hypothetical protein